MQFEFDYPHGLNFEYFHHISINQIKIIEMQTASLMRHTQILTQAGEAQGWHPHSVARWLFFLLPLIYFLAVTFYVLKRIRFVRSQSWTSTQGADSHVTIIALLFIGAVFGSGLYAAIADAWSARQWVLWTAALIFGAFTLLAYSTHDDCGLHVGLAIAAFCGFFWFFFSEWLYAQTHDMHQSIWKHIVRNFLGFAAAVTFIHWVVLLGRVLVYIFGWTQGQQAKFFWAVAILGSILLAVINITVYGPFLCAIGFILGALLYLIIAALSYTSSTSLPLANPNGQPSVHNSHVHNEYVK